MGNLLKRLQNIGCGEKADKYGCDGRVVFNLVFGELRHYLITMERGSQNCGGLIHSGRTQLVPPQNKGPIQVVKHPPQLII